MKLTIWKFILETTDNQKIEMPKGSVILTVQNQHNSLCMWVLVDREAEKETRHFEVFGTGHPIKHDATMNRKYIGTYQLQGGSLVFHVFELQVSTAKDRPNVLQPIN